MAPAVLQPPHPLPQLGPLTVTWSQQLISDTARTFPAGPSVTQDGAG